MQTIREIMTPDPVLLRKTSTLSDAAKAMQARDIGAILLTDEGGQLCGIVTDRDLVVRGLASGKDPNRTQLAEVCSEAVTRLTPDDSVDNAVKLMAKKGIRRIPVVDGMKPVGVLSLGDLAIARDPDSALGTISSAPPNQ